MKTTLQVPFPRGTCAIEVFGTPEDRAAPVVLLFMDVFGPRPALFGIGRRLAEAGYRVLLPDLFYDHQPFAPLNTAAVFAGDPAERKRMMGKYQSLDQARIDADVRALLSWAEGELGPQAPAAAVGYCMGGRYALTAAAEASRVVLAASVHGGNLAPESGDGPHLRLKGIAARVYVGVAAIDPTFGAAEEGRLACALREAGVDHIIETYAGAVHGFAMNDLPTHHAAAYQRHWTRLSALLAEAFQPSRSTS
ncbi:MAG: dienelactone hydrolase family protein [Nevskia sp.]|nr:dienelactone hydrolase family protein [Nevskia sp.]